MRLVFSQRFRNELEREYAFLGKDNPEAACRTIERIVKTCRQLKEFPRSGRVGLLVGAWEMIVPGTRYVVAYDIGEDRIDVLMLFHTSRQVPHVH